MAESTKAKDRICRVCRQVFVVTSKEIKLHAKKCNGVPQAKGV